MPCRFEWSPRSVAPRRIALWVHQAARSLAQSAAQIPQRQPVLAQTSWIAVQPAGEPARAFPQRIQPAGGHCQCVAKCPSPPSSMRC